MSNKLSYSFMVQRIKEALLAANEAILINEKRLLECYDDLEAFIQLTDSIEDIIVKEAECCDLPAVSESPQQRGEHHKTPLWVSLAIRVYIIAIYN